jgi:ElaB/YqjD/DUF883 family membrane-anchored ribosome-binding protein
LSYRNFSGPGAFILPPRSDAMPTDRTTQEFSDVLESSVKNLQNDLSAIKGDLKLFAEQLSTLMGRKARSRAGETRARLDEAISDATDRGQEAFETVRDTVDSWSTDAEETLKRNPLMAIGIALGVGFLLGAAWRR